MNRTEGTDKCGYPLLVGSYIVYGHNLGRCAGLKFGKIVKIDTYNDAPRYHVIGVDDDWDHRDPELTKRGMLLYEDRIIVLPFNFLPKYAKELLENVPVE